MRSSVAASPGDRATEPGAEPVLECAPACVQGGRAGEPVSECGGASGLYNSGAEPPPHPEVLNRRSKRGRTLKDSECSPGRPEIRKWDTHGVRVDAAKLHAFLRDCGATVVYNYRESPEQYVMLIMFIPVEAPASGAGVRPELAFEWAASNRSDNELSGIVLLSKQDFEERCVKPRPGSDRVMYQRVRTLLQRSCHSKLFSML